jgi:hypothetical protein
LQLQVLRPACHGVSQECHVFETMAFLSTIGLAAIFVILYRIDRAGRREEEAAASSEPGPHAQ